MRRFLLILLGLLGTAQPAVRAEAPFLSPRVGADSLSSLLASPEEPATFGIRFVACLADDDSLALIDVDDQTHDNESNSNQADGRDEQQRTESLVKPSARRDGHPATAGRIVEAVDSATSDDAVANAISPRDLKHAMSAVDDARVRARLAELNKPATLLTVAPPPVTAGDEPVNRAAVVFDQSPYWILGGPSVPPPPQRVHVVFHHNPTYFQELNLERCGKLDCARCGYLQNLYSSVWFIGNTSLLPFRLAAQPPCECVAAYGDCPTCHQYQCPVEPLQVGDSCLATSRGTLSQSAALAGFVLLLW